MLDLPTMSGTRVDLFLASCSAKELGLPGAAVRWRKWQEQDGKVVPTAKRSPVFPPFDVWRLSSP